MVGCVSPSVTPSQQVDGLLFISLPWAQQAVSEALPDTCPAGISVPVHCLHVVGAYRVLVLQGGRCVKWLEEFETEPSCFI